MIKQIWILIFSISLGYNTYAQNILNGDSDSLINKQISIEELIKIKEKDKTQRDLLIKFKNTHQKNDKIIVEEFSTYYKLTVSHLSDKNNTGGAECYNMDKKTGKISMEWHEHPMQIPEEEFKADTLEIKNK